MKNRSKYQIKLAKWASVSGYMAGVKAPVYMMTKKSTELYNSQCELFGIKNVVIKDDEWVYRPVYIN